ncbi:MAG TPA: DUF2637 domain-containing protein [Streptosporangiaceae bacterium]|nr:DUF2637 domain-containing protein [Streptosporangiaceae bacterium]
MPPTPPGAARQRLLTAAAGLGVAALAGAAFALSYDDLRVLALAGGAAERYAPIYPIMIDTLVVVTILSLVLARRTKWWTRGVRWLLLLALLAGAAAAGAQRAVKGYDPLPDKGLSAGVAVAPWVLLLLAAWLWLSMFRHARSLFGRPGAGAPDESGALAPSGTVRVVPTRAEATRPEEADHLVPGLVLEAAYPAPRERPEDDAEPARPRAAERANVPASLPTDIKLVTHAPASAKQAAEASSVSATATTQPDLVMPGHAAVAEDRAEDPDAGAEHDGAAADKDDKKDDDKEDDDVERWSALAAEDAERWAGEAADHFSGAPQPPVEWIPPASKFRSSPTPPRD